MALRSDSDLQASWGPGQGQKTVEQEGREKALKQTRGVWGKRSRCRAEGGSVQEGEEGCVVSESQTQVKLGDRDS